MYRYIFDLKKRKHGLVVATRYETHPGPLAADQWDCVAPDNEAALELARRAALAEWPPVVGRARNDFVVTFSDASEAEPVETTKLSTKTGVHLKVSARPSVWRRLGGSAGEQ